MYGYFKNSIFMKDCLVQSWQLAKQSTQGQGIRMGRSGADWNPTGTGGSLFTGRGGSLVTAQVEGCSQALGKDDPEG